ncbi:MAG: glycosyltransferase family 8 protein [Planctomycetaceae bacterium]|nr:glycosyltransferase family 8 protein [Planctomycetaceae bacterium]
MHTSNSTNTEPIHVVFAADTGYYQHLCVTLVSILENNRDLRFHAHVLTNQLSEEAEAPLKSLEKKYDNLVLDFQAVDDSQFGGLKLTIDYISVQTYYRYVLARIFPELDKVLYLDCDLVVRGSLRELWEENLDGYHAAGVFDTYINNHEDALLQRIGFQGRNDYINTGVMLFHLKSIRENNLVDEFFSCQQTNQDIIEFQDQDIINMVLKGRIKLLPAKFNWIDNKIPGIFEPVIVHYVGNIKPWSLHDRRKHVYKKEYFKYLRRTPYSGYRHYYNMIQGCYILRDFIFHMKTNSTAFRIKVFGIRIYKRKISPS